MTKIHFRKTLLVVLAVAFLAGLIGKVAFTGTEDPTKLNAVKVTTAPLLDGDGGDAAWEKATEYEIALGKVKVGIKAVYTEKDLFVLAKWNDSTFSIVRGGSWVWDGDAWNVNAKYVNAK